jgi:hypothetical protein
MQIPIRSLEAVPMTHTVGDGLTKAFAAVPWLFEPAAFGEVVAVLSEALGPDWTVGRETDCEGDVSIIALSTLDAEGMPAFILYEKDGKTHVATVKDDEWECDRRFDSFRQAIDAFIAEGAGITDLLTRMLQAREQSILQLRLPTLFAPTYPDPRLTF